ncbi:MerR family transcriptional regulator [Citricoccus sp. NPDC079358]|uniref:MerR family transcriptional regulator n=1 Tax=Citricoccus sp. NPDC079358 TaxID=3154653 RepID=UPI00344FB64D
MKQHEAQVTGASVGTMQIGEVAERTQLSLRTIRHYDQVGLVPPSARTEGGFRLYTEDDVERLNHVRRITPLGFSLEDAAEILALLEGASPAEDSGRYLDQAREAREKLARKLSQADELIDALAALGKS